jgi:hypothetical protein
VFPISHSGAFVPVLPFPHVNKGGDLGESLSDKSFPKYISTHLKGVNASGQTTVIRLNIRNSVVIGEQQLDETAL